MNKILKKASDETLKEARGGLYFGSLFRIFMCIRSAIIAYLNPEPEPDPDTSPLDITGGLVDASNAPTDGQDGGLELIP